MVNIFRFLKIPINITKLKTKSDSLIKNIKYESKLGKETQTILQNAVVKVSNDKILKNNISFHNDVYQKLMEDKIENGSSKKSITSVYQSKIQTQDSIKILKNCFPFTNEEIRIEVQNMMEKTKGYKVNPKTLQKQQESLMKFLYRAVNEIIQDNNKEKKYDTVKVQFALLINKSLDKINLIMQSPHTSKIGLIVLLEKLCVYLFDYNVESAENHASFMENFIRRFIFYYSTNIIVSVLLKMTKFIIELYFSEIKKEETKKEKIRRRNKKIYRGVRHNNLNKNDVLTRDTLKTN